MAQPRPCKLRIVVTDERQNPVADATVEVQDAVGFAAAGTSKQTTQDGQVDFNSYTGVHRIRVTGSEIHAYEGDFEISPNESSHIERIRVKMKNPVGASDAAPAGPPVSAARLKIPKNAEKEYDKGNKAAEKQNWAAAASAYRAAINAYPEEPVFPLYNLIEAESESLALASISILEEGNVVPMPTLPLLTAIGLSPSAELLDQIGM